MPSRDDLREAAFQELLGSPEREPTIWSCLGDSTSPFENYQRVVKLRGIERHRSSAQLAVEMPFGAALSAREILWRRPDDLLGACASAEEVILLLAAALRTLQFFAGGEERHTFRLDLISAAEQLLPDLSDRAPGIRHFADSEGGRVTDERAEATLLADGDPTSLHALAHLRLSSAWMSRVDHLIHDERASVSDPRVRHLLAHRLLADSDIGPVEFVRAVNTHFATPASPGSLNSLLRDLVPLALAYEQRWDADGATEFWIAAASIADRLPFGSEWLLTEACRVLAYRKVGRTDECEPILEALRDAGHRCADEPGWGDGVECVIALASSVHAGGGVSSDLGGSRDQHETIGSAMA